MFHRGALVALFAIFLAGPASAVEILEVDPDDETKGVLNIGLRDAGDAVPTISVDGAEVTVETKGRAPTSKWQPLMMIVDTTNISEDRLGKVKTNMSGLAAREFKNGSKFVVISDQRGVGAEGTSTDSIAGAIKTTLESYKVIPNPDPRGSKPHYSTISQFLGQRLSNVPVVKAQPWALIFSSLCVSPDDEPPAALKGFKGPIRILTWDAGLHDKCGPNREAWLEKLRALREIEVYNLDDPTQSAQVDAARQGRTDVTDVILTVAGVPYSGGLIAVKVEIAGVEKPFENTWKEDAVPDEWARQARMEQSAKVRIGAAIAFGIMVLIVIGIAVVKARSGGMEVAKWEAVGEAEDLSSSMDPDAWNATIFQLTGAMPALKEVREAAQLGPSERAGAAAPAGKESAEKLDDTKADDKAPIVDEVPEGADSTAAIPDGSTPELKKTGMTVAMPVLDDGTGYEANAPFEIGVLLSGKPVARKTKKFRKVFSIGRATDNRVVIQKDDTVHRYHVVVRPALQGKEWWLEVSPTSTNRTNLNGKDLRPGGRYRLPARFRLQLGEATEVRGRQSKTS